MCGVHKMSNDIWILDDIERHRVIVVDIVIEVDTIGVILAVGEVSVLLRFRVIDRVSLFFKELHISLLIIIFCSVLNDLDIVT